MTTPHHMDAVDERRLRGYVRLNLLADLAAIAWLVAVRLWLVPSGWLHVIIGILVGLALSFVGAGVLLNRGRRVAAIVTVAVANWLTVIAVAAMSPFTLSIVPMFVLLPVLLSVPYLRRFQLNAMFGAAVVVIVATAVGGRLSAGVGIEAQSPDWMLDALAVAFVPTGAVLALFIAWQSHLALAAKTVALRDSRVRLVTAADRERCRIERSLAEGTRRRVITVGTYLRLARKQQARGEQVEHALEQAITELREASRELRDLGHGIFPPELTAHGLVAALRTTSHVTLYAGTVGRYPPEVEASVYFCCVEVLTVIDHGGDNRTGVTINLADENGLTFTISGHGTADVASSDYFTGVADRLGAVGGTMVVHASASGAFQVYGRIPRPFPSQPRPSGWRRCWDTSCDVLGRIWKRTGRVYGRLPVTGTGHELAAAGIGSVMFLMVGSAVLSFLVYPLMPNPWVIVGGVVDVVLAGALAWARRTCRRGLVTSALLVAMMTTWIHAIVLAVLVPIALEQTPLYMLLSAILAIPHVGRRTFRAVTAITVAVALLIAVSSRFLPGVGIQEQAPEWVADATLSILIVLTSILVLFAASLNHAVDIRRAEELQNSRARLVAAADQERRRIERDLHDGAQQRLVAAAVEARVALLVIESRTHHQACTLLTQLAQDVSAIEHELRDLASGIYPSELVAHGLEAALRSAARRCSLPTTLHMCDIGRLHPRTEINVYFCCLEALQNASKHAGDSATVEIILRRQHGLEFEVRDTGQGCESTVAEAGHGYANMQDRLSAIGGKLLVSARPGLGVQVLGQVCEAALAQTDREIFQATRQGAIAGGI